MEHKRNELKTTKKEKSLFRKAKLALDLIDEVLVHKRLIKNEQVIPFNCKIHDWLGTEDLEKIIKDHQLPPALAEKVKEEFSDFDVSDLPYPEMDNEIKNFLSNAAKKIDTEFVGMIQECMWLWPDLNTPYDPLNLILSRKKSFRSASWAIRNYFTNSKEGIPNLASIHFKNIFSFAEKSFWQSIASAKVFERRREEICYATDYFFINEKLPVTQNHSNSKRHLLV